MAPYTAPSVPLQSSSVVRAGGWPCHMQLTIASSCLQGHSDRLQEQLHSPSQLHLPAQPQRPGGERDSILTAAGFCWLLWAGCAQRGHAARPFRALSACVGAVLQLPPLWSAEAPSVLQMHTACTAGAAQQAAQLCLSTEALPAWCCRASASACSGHMWTFHSTTQRSSDSSIRQWLT